MTVFAGVDGDYANAFAEKFTKEAICYFGFENSLEGPLILGMELEESGKRNPFSIEFQLVSLEWQCYTKDGWIIIEVIEDQTGGLLCNGLLTLEIPQKTVLWRHESGMMQAHYIRCILRENSYDELPRIGSVFINPIDVVQQETLCHQIIMIYQGEDQIQIPYYIPEDSRMSISVKREDGCFVLVYPCGDNQKDIFGIVESENPYEKWISFFIKPEIGSEIEVTIAREKFASDMKKEKTDGCIFQEIPFSFEGIYEIGISLWKDLSNETTVYEKWNYIEDLTLATYKEKVFTYDFEEEVIRFGDGIHGCLPEQGFDIFITTLRISNFKNGNVMQREINRLPCQKYVDIKNPNAAYGGQFYESVKEMMVRLETILFKQNRMVSPEDYVNIVKSTPGLMIESACVVSSSEYSKMHNVPYNGNEVYVVVQPYSKSQTSTLSRIYYQKIVEHIEPYRLLNIKVNVVSPRYVGVEIFGKISLFNMDLREQNEVMFVIQKLLMDTNERKYGKVLVLGKIFSKIEAIPCVKQIYSLSLNRVGKSARQNSRGDIQFDKDTLSYIRNIDIEFC